MRSSSASDKDHVDAATVVLGRRRNHIRPKTGGRGRTNTDICAHTSGEWGSGTGSRRQRCAVADILTSASARVRSRQTTGVRRWSVCSLVTMSTKLTLFSRATMRSRHPTKLLKKMCHATLIAPISGTTRRQQALTCYR